MIPHTIPCLLLLMSALSARAAPRGLLVASVLQPKALADCALDACAACRCSSGTVDCSALGLSAVPCNIPADTTVLRLDGNAISTLLLGTLGGLPLLEELHLSGNGLTAFEPSDISGLKKLTLIDISLNSITTLSPDLLANTTQLLDFIANDNALVSVPATLFASTPDIENIVLTSNAITSVPEGLFQGLKSLLSVSISYNAITSLPADTFRDTVAMQSLDIGFNQLTSISEDIFASMTNISMIVMNYNLFSTLPTGLYRNNVALAYLDIGGGHFVTLNESIFAGLTAINDLLIYDGQLQYLPPGIFASQSSLNHQIDMSSDKLTALPAGVFAGLTQLQWLDNNHLSEIHPHLFDEAVSMIELGISGNNIMKLDGTLFCNLTRLSGLFLAGNRLATLPPGFFSSLHALTILDLSDNSIADIGAGLSLSTSLGLQELYLRDNLLTTLFKSALPPGTLQVIDIRFNKLDTIEEGMFYEHLSTLEYLAMDGNPSECYLGLSTSFDKTVYCSCATGFVSRVPDSCSLLQDVMYTPLPSRVGPGYQYAFKGPANASVQFASPCGSVSNDAAGSYLLTPVSGLPIHTVCPLNQNGDATGWNFSIADVTMFVFFLTIPASFHETFSLQVGQPMTPYNLPTRFQVLFNYTFASHTLFASDAVIPPGLVFDQQKGLLYGTPQNTTNGSVVLTFYLKDEFTEVIAPVAVVTLMIAASQASNGSGSTSTNIIVVIVTVSVLAVVLLLVGAVLAMRYYRRYRLHQQQVADVKRRIPPAVLAVLSKMNSGKFTVPRAISPLSLTFLDMLGEGKFGAVMKAMLDEQDETGVPGYLVAVKMVKEDAPLSHTADLRLEGAIMAQFSHPNVVGLIGQVSEGDLFLVVTQYCELGSLLSWLSTSGSSAGLLVMTHMCIDVTAGMAYLSSLGIVHRDLAARNVLVSSNLTCKVSDFGFARHSEKGTVRTTTKDPVAIRWAAPEAVADQRYTSKSDVWSFGVLLYEVFSFADLPYGGWKNQRVIEELRKGYRLSKPVACPDAVYAIMLKAWHADPVQRPDFDVLRDELQEVAQAEEETHRQSMYTANKLIKRFTDAKLAARHRAQSSQISIDSSRSSQHSLSMRRESSAYMEQRRSMAAVAHYSGGPAARLLSAASQSSGRPFFPEKHPSTLSSMSTDWTRAHPVYVDLLGTNDAVIGADLYFEEAPPVFQRTPPVLAIPGLFALQTTASIDSSLAEIIAEVEAPVATDHIIAETPGTLSLSAGITIRSRLMAAMRRARTRQSPLPTGASSSELEKPSKRHQPPEMDSPLPEAAGERSWKLFRRSSSGESSRATTPEVCMEQKEVQAGGGDAPRTRSGARGWLGVRALVQAAVGDASCLPLDSFALCSVLVSVTNARGTEPAARVSRVFQVRSEASVSEAPTSEQAEEAAAKAELEYGTFPQDGARVDVFDLRSRTAVAFPPASSLAQPRSKARQPTFTIDVTGAGELGEFEV